MTTDTIKMPKKFNYSCINEFNEQFEKIAANSTTVFLNFEDVEYVDSAGIGILVMAQKKAKSMNVRMIVTKLTASIKEILELANLQKIIEFK